MTRIAPASPAPHEVLRARRPAERHHDPRGSVWLLRPRPIGDRFDAIERDAARTMLQHGLDGWAFGFGRGKRTLGTTRVRAGAAVGTIRLSRHLVASGPDGRVRDTLLHEIAHAVAYRRHGRTAMNHGPLWRAIAREVGAEPSATCRGAPVAPPTHVLVCRACGARVGLYRTPKHPAAAYRHKGCGGRFRFERGGGTPPTR
jgi:predicted SprT family Zn-dependent metalloprotease